MARVLISMKDDFLKQIDDVAVTEQRTRSELIREALRQYIRRYSNEVGKKESPLQKPFSSSLLEVS